MLAHVGSTRVGGVPYGRYLYAEDIPALVLYASNYAGMMRHLYAELDGLGDWERRKWISHLQAHQDDDGLFRDPAICGQRMYAGHPEWCGRHHLSCPIVAALTCLGAVAEKPQRWLEPFSEPEGIERWLAERDFQGHPLAGDATRRLPAWLSSHEVNPRTGVWGGLDARYPCHLSRLIQAAYHSWPLYVCDHEPTPYPERAVDALLLTQDPRGGFGWGVHNRQDPWNGSAGADIDSIDGLARLLARRTTGGKTS